MPWFQKRTLILFVRDTKVRRYEPRVSKSGVDVESSCGPLMGATDPDTDTRDSNPNRTLSLETTVVHGHLVR